MLCFAGPLTATVFGYGRFAPRDVRMASYALMAYSWGLLGFSLVKVLAPGYYARQDTRRPVRIALIALGCTMALNVLVVLPAAHFGFPLPHVLLATSTCIGAAINSVLLWRGLTKIGVFTPSLAVAEAADARHRREPCDGCAAVVVQRLARDVARDAVRSSGSRRCAAGIGAGAAVYFAIAVRARAALPGPANPGGMMRLQRRLDPPPQSGRRLRRDDRRVRWHPSRPPGAGAAGTRAGRAALGLRSLLLSFEPLPREFFTRDASAGPAHDFPRTLAAARPRSDLDVFCVLRFCERLRNQSADDFAEALARGGIRRVLVGHDFRAGKGATGDVAFLRAAGRKLGFEVEVLEPVCEGGERISSRGCARRWRRAISRPPGELARAALFDARPRDARAAARTQARLPDREPAPRAAQARRSTASSRCACAARWPARRVDGVASLGTRPTVGGTVPLLEAHLFDFGGDLYGRELEVEFVAKLRDEQQFDALDALVEQMNVDAAQARQRSRPIRLIDDGIRNEFQWLTTRAPSTFPQTDFPMKADLAQREPEMLECVGTRTRSYGELREIARGRPRFVLHDGPPYANGAIHIGHAVNKILKDIIVKSHSLDGYDSPYIPGWDCHGLPIEHAGREEARARRAASSTRSAFRAACRELRAASRWSCRARISSRLGVFGDWDRPYLTMDPQFEAQQIRALGHIIEQRPPLSRARSRCTGASTAARRSPKPRSSTRTRCRPPIDVAFARRRRRRSRATRSAMRPSVGAAAVDVVIWTTTPWTLPANEAVALRAEFEYVLVSMITRRPRRESLVLAERAAARPASRATARPRRTCWRSSRAGARRPAAAAPVPATSTCP